MYSDRSVYQRALENREKRTWAATTMDEVKELAKANTGYIKTMWCGDLACEMKMKEEAGLSSRCMPFEQEQLSDVCPCCGKPAKAMAFFDLLRQQKRMRSFYGQNSVAQSHKIQ